MVEDLREIILEEHRDEFEALYNSRCAVPAPQFEGSPEEQGAFEKGFRMGLLKGYGEGLIDGAGVILQVGLESLGGGLYDEPFAGSESDDDLAS